MVALFPPWLGKAVFSVGWVYPTSERPDPSRPRVEQMVYQSIYAGSLGLGAATFPSCEVVSPGLCATRWRGLGVVSLVHPTVEDVVVESGPGPRGRAGPGNLLCWACAHSGETGQSAALSRGRTPPRWEVPPTKCRRFSLRFGQRCSQRELRRLHLNGVRCYDRGVHPRLRRRCHASARTATRPSD